MAEGHWFSSSLILCAPNQWSSSFFASCVFDCCLCCFLCLNLALSIPVFFPSSMFHLFNASLMASDPPMSIIISCTDSHWHSFTCMLPSRNSRGNMSVCDVLEVVDRSAWGSGKAPLGSCCRNYERFSFMLSSLCAFKTIEMQTIVLHF